MFTKELKTILEKAYGYSINNKQKYFVIENLLLASMEDDSIINFIEETSPDSVDAIKLFLKNYLDDEIEKVDTSRNVPPIETPAIKRIIESLRLNSKHNHQESNQFDLLSKFYYEDDSLAKQLLEDNEISHDLVKEIAYNFSRNQVRNEYEIQIDPSSIADFLNLLSPHFKNNNKKLHPYDAKSNNKENSKDFPTLNKFGINLNELAKNGKFDNLIGREEEIQRVIQVISKKKKNNPLLLGEPGVGKTAIIEGMAQKIVKGEVPENIKNKIIFSIDTTSLVAGTSFRGEFEQNMKMLIEEAKSNKNIILFIDEFHNIFGLGSAGGDKMDASNILKPYLARGEISLIGATTFEEASKSIDKNKAMNRRFQKIDIDEPNKEETFMIVKGIKKSYEDFHDMKISNKILKDIVDLSDKYIFDKHFPDKAIDVIDEIGSHRKINFQNSKNVTSKEVHDIISKIANSPISANENNEKKMLKDLEKNIKSNLFGQDKSITPIVDQIFMHRSGLIDSSKPIGSFLFAGPSGTGKTELARQVAKNLDMKLLRYDMGEYSEEISVSKLFGSSSGYVGYEEGGLLINDVKKHPSSVIVFDEIEKANPKVINSLLQILEEAEGTSGNGTKVTFQNSIIIFTSNAGSKSHIEKTMGFLNDGGESKQVNDIKNFFTPEFRNRLNEVIIFDSLSKKDLINIVDKFIKNIEIMLEDKNIKIELNEEAKEWFAEKGYDESLGARPMSRLIDDKIKKEISKGILFGKIKKDSIIKVVCENNEIKIVK